MAREQFSPQREETVRSIDVPESFLFSWVNRLHPERVNQAHEIAPEKWDRFFSILYANSVDFLEMYQLKNTQEKPKDSVETVKKNVITAAERGEAVERDYEMRHEVKDDANPFQGAVKVSTVIDSAIGLQNAPHATENAGLSSRPALKEVASRRKQASTFTYKAAITTGLVAGLVILCFMLLLYVVNR